MGDQPGFFDTEEWLRELSEADDPLERLTAVIDFEIFRGDLDAALQRSDRRKGGRRRCPCSRHPKPGNGRVGNAFSRLAGFTSRPGPPS